MNTPDQAIAFEAIGPQFQVGHCLENVVTAYKLTGQNPAYDAAGAYAMVAKPGQGAPPLGAVLWWTGGQSGHGHVALADGYGGCYSTDFIDAGYVGDGKVHHVMDFRNISARDTLLTYRGWSCDLEGIEVVSPQQAPPTPGDDEDMILFKKKTVSTIYAYVAGNKRAVVTGHQLNVIAQVTGKAPTVHEVADNHEWLSLPMVQ